MMPRSDVKMVKSSHIEKSIFLPTLKKDTIFVNWKYRISLFLEQEGVLDAVQGNVDISENFEKKDCKARMWIVLSVADELLKIVTNCKSAQDMIKQLEVHFQQKAAFSKYDLKKQLLTMKLETSENLQTHFEKFDILISELEAVGCNLDESDKVCHLLLTLPEEYKTIVASLDAMMSLSESLMEFIKARLLDTAMRLNQTELNYIAEHGTCLTAVVNRQLFQPTEQRIMSNFEEYPNYPNTIDDSYRTDSPVTIKSESKEMREMLRCNVVLEDVAKELCCDVCSRWCISVEELQNHKQTHAETPMASAVKKLRCVLCQAEFTSKITLVEHFETHSTTIKPIIHHTKTIDSPIIMYENFDITEHDIYFRKIAGVAETQSDSIAAKKTLDSLDVHSDPTELISEEHIANSDSKNHELRQSTSPCNELCPELEVDSTTDSRSINRGAEPLEVCLDTIAVRTDPYMPIVNKSEDVWLETATASVKTDCYAPLEKLRRHKLTHASVTAHKGLRCALCQAGFTSKVSLVEHFKTHSTNLESINVHTKKTDSQNIIYKNSDLAEQNVAGASESKQNSNALKSMLGFNRCRDQALRCILCQAGFTSKVSLVEHFKTHPTNMKPIIRHIDDTSPSSSIDVDCQKVACAAETNTVSKLTPDDVKLLNAKLGDKVIANTTSSDCHREMDLFEKKEQRESQEIVYEQKHGLSKSSSLLSSELCSDGEVDCIRDYDALIDNESVEVYPDYDNVASIRTDSYASDETEPPEVCWHSNDVLNIKDTQTPAVKKPEEVWLDSATVSVKTGPHAPVENESEKISVESDMSQAAALLHNSKNFVCDFCSTGFNSKITLIKHLNTNHTEYPETFHHKVQQDFSENLTKTIYEKKNQSFICEYCNKTFWSLTNMLKHKFTHNLEKNRLIHRNTKYTSRSAFIHHIEKAYIKSPDPDPVTGPTNSGTFMPNKPAEFCVDPDDILDSSTPMKNNQENVVAVLDTSAALQHHSKPDLYDSSRFNSKLALIDHLNTNDTAESSDPKLNVITTPDKTITKTKICKYCGKEFSSVGLMLRHEVIHTGVRNFWCDICKFKFTLRSSLIKHINKQICERYINAGKKPICEYCGKKFLRVGLMLRHEVKHTGVKNYWCDICKYKFTLRSSLIKHIKTIHEGEKKYQCSICGKCFTSKEYQIKHAAVHNKLKLFQCEVCGQCFSYKTSLTKHQMLHLNIRLFQCEICGKKFQREGCFIRHKENVHSQ